MPDTSPLTPSKLKILQAVHARLDETDLFFERSIDLGLSETDVRKLIDVLTLYQMTSCKADALSVNDILIYLKEALR